MMNPRNESNIYPQTVSTTFMTQFQKKKNLYDHKPCQYHYQTTGRERYVKKSKHWFDGCTSSRAVGGKKASKPEDVWLLSVSAEKRI